MNKSTLFSFVTLLGVASICVAGIFHDGDEEHTRVTGRRRMHLLHGGESKSERQARKHGEYTETKEETRGGRTVRKTTTTRRASRPRTVRKEETKVSE